MYKPLDTLRLLVITGALIALGIGIFKYMHSKPNLPFHAHAYVTANTQVEKESTDVEQPVINEQVAIQTLKAQPKKPGSSAPAPHGTQPQPNGSTSCTPAYGKCSGTGKSSCCAGYGCCQGVCKDTGLFGTQCP